MEIACDVIAIIHFLEILGYVLNQLVFQLVARYSLEKIHAFDQRLIIQSQEEVMEIQFNCNSREVLTVRYLRFHDDFYLTFLFQEGTCIQCHSGYKIDSERKCHRFTSHRIINEFQSYFSSDGELHSRSLQFIPFSDHGVFPAITHCSVHGNQYGDSFDTLKCQECSSGKSLNQSRTLCVKQPFEYCRIVSDTDHSSCEECIFNDHFYLHTNNSSKQQTCLPRQQLDPTVRCLEYSQDSQICLSCPAGLFATHTGCSLEKWVSEDQDIQQIDDYSYKRLRSIDSNCELWITDSLCGSCLKEMIVNNKGQCSVNLIEFCLIPHEEGGCARCISLMFYDKDQNACTPISNSLLCSHSLGISDKCEKCFSNSYLIGDEKILCDFTEINHCKMSQGLEKNCEQCINLFYLNNPQECLAITDFQDCVLSDGVTNQCLLCRSNHILNEKGQCISQVYHENGLCIDPMYYLDQSTNTCVAYDFENKYLCYEFDPHQNRCLECNSGYFIEDNFCQSNFNCAFSDGIQNICYQAKFSTWFITEEGKAQVNRNHTCFTNRIENTCLHCSLENGNPGIIAENLAVRNDNTIQDENNKTTCISKENIENEIVLLNCYALKYNPTASQFFCMLCFSLHFPNENGVCIPITDTNCQLTNGRTNVCLLCKKGYQFNQTISICQLKDPQKVIPFCSKMEGSVCVKCKNLYFKSNNFLCLPIFDPDCAESDGIDLFCQKCKNGLDLIENGFYRIQIYCVQLFSLIELTEEANEIGNRIFDHVKSNLKKQAVEQDEKLKDNYLFQTIMKATMQILETSHCKAFSGYFAFCTSCNQGFSSIVPSYFEQQCRTIYLPYCQQPNINQIQCEVCQEGYDLTSNKQCIFIESCLKFDKICMQCSKEYYLQEGQCIKVVHCLQQIEKMCLQCEPGYFVMRKTDLGKNKGENKVELEGEVKLKSFCVRIPHCIESDGVRESCQNCSLGYEIINSICVKTSKNQKFFDDCEEFTNENTCMRCKNLFYLQDSQCLHLKTDCQRNNGIDKQCMLCSFEGFIIDSDGDCKLLDFCDVSNGINQCIICKASYMVDSKGNCIQISKQIDNCEVYYMQYDQEEVDLDKDNLNELPQDKVNSNPKKESQQFSSSIVNQNVKESQSCYKCKPLFTNNNQSSQECLHLHEESLNQCQFSNGISQFCSICNTGFIQKQYLMPNLQTQSCQLIKKAVKSMNLGCELVFEKNQCLQCFESFFMDADSRCLPRALTTNCVKFHPRKDQCLECRSGYQLQTITEHFIEKIICLKLPALKQVDNCSEYYPNTNKCMRCIKRINADVMEYYLNEKDNICEDILRFMCRTYNPKDKMCLQPYIENCKIYSQNAGISQNCLECLDRYYLGYTLKPNGINETTCIQHRNIENCLIFSQESPDTCVQCEPEYFLKSLNLCIHISHSNCKIADRHQDKCKLCNDKFAVDLSGGGNCREILIDNCIEFEGSFTNQICKKCKDNFQLQVATNKCQLKFIDINCKLVSDSVIQKCFECNQDYILTQEGNCVHTNQHCRPSDNCLKYKENTQNTQGGLCEQCQTGYFVDENFKCVSQLLQNQDLLKEELNQTNQEKQENNGLIWIYSSLIGIMLIVIAGCILRRKIKIVKNGLKESRITKAEEINSLAESQRINVEFLKGKHIEMCQEESILDISDSISASRDMI